MADFAVLASGNGGNFEALATAGGRHRVACLFCDRKNAFAFDRARRLGIPAHYIRYGGRPREDAERELIVGLRAYRPTLIVCAGFMRIFTPLFVDAFPGAIVNIHPSLLPRHPGPRAIEESFASGDERLGISIHFIDYGTDSGPLIFQASFERRPGLSLREFETAIHDLEHEHYPRVVSMLLDEIEKGAQKQ